MNLVTEFEGATTPGTLYPVPDENSFLDEATGKPRDFIRADESLYTVVEAMAEKYSELDHIAKFKVGVMWKREGGESQGRLVFGKLVKPSGLLRYFCPWDFVVQLSADNCANAKFTYFQIEALIYRTLKHSDIRYDGKTGETKAALRGPDFEGFLDELKRYGTWHSATQAIREVLQPGLFDAIERAEVAGTGYRQ